MDHGLKFVMDFNEDRWGSVSRNRDNYEEGVTKDILDNDVGDYVERGGESARVYFQNIGKVLFLGIHNITSILEPLTFNGKGDYALSDIKEFEVTDGFINLGEKVTKCQNRESFEECNTREYLKRAQEECSCTPFSLSHLNDTVSLRVD